MAIAHRAIVLWVLWRVSPRTKTSSHYEQQSKTFKQTKKSGKNTHTQQQQQRQQTEKTMIHLYVLIEIIYACTCVLFRCLSHSLARCRRLCFTFYYCYYVCYVYTNVYGFSLLFGLCVVFLSLFCCCREFGLVTVNDITKSLSFAAQHTRSLADVALLFLLYSKFGPSIVSHCSSFNTFTQNNSLL